MELQNFQVGMIQCSVDTSPALIQQEVKLKLDFQTLKMERPVQREMHSPVSAF